VVGLKKWDADQSKEGDWMSHNQEQQKWILEVSLSPFMERFLPYRGQYVAVQGNRLIAHPTLAEVLQEARASGKPFTIYAIPRELGKLRILPIRIRSLGFHFWNPMYNVTWQCPDGSWLDSSALVDSGADVSVIPLEFGQELGLTLAPKELHQQAIGLGGTLDIVLRQAVVKIDEVIATIPVAWVQESASADVILGRAVILVYSTLHLNKLKRLSSLCRGR